MCPVLIVEDNPMFRDTLKGILATRFPSIVVEEASNAEEALSKFEETNPFLIFMDIRLPGKNGLEITRTIKETAPEIEIIILTSFDIPEYREAAFHSGASHFLTKGRVTIEVITSLVASALRSDKKCCFRSSGKRRQNYSVGFGTFSVGERAAREGGNPRTGEKINIPASKAVKFKAGKTLSEKVK